MENICGKCKFFNDRRQMVNKSFICNYHMFTVNYNEMGCYLIQISNIDNKNKVKSNKNTKK